MDPMARGAGGGAPKAPAFPTAAGFFWRNVVPQRPVAATCSNFSLFLVYKVGGESKARVKI